MRSIKPEPKKKQINMFAAVAVLVIFVLGAAAGVYVLSGRTDDSQPQVDMQTASEDVSVAQQPEPDVEVSGRYLFSGTIVLARAVERYALDQAGERDYSQPFSQLDTLERDKYNAWLADLECPVTDTFVSYQQQINNLVFNCPLEFLPEFAEYFDIVNLANNHTSDMGADGFAETQANLSAAGIQHVGSYDPSSSDDVCEVIGLPVTVTTDGADASGTLPIAFCAWHYFFRDPLPGELEVMERYSEVMPVFAFQHAGVEYVAQAGGNQEPIARKLIDLGADFVIGNSPHWVQNTEVYNGKLIAYSTGNFIFDQLEYETNRGASFDLKIDLEHDENLTKWLELGDMCIADNDSCLQQAIDQDLQKPELAMEWDIVASVGGVRELTRKAPEDVQQSVEQRANWQETASQLQGAAGASAQ